jgi:hypothetical protein
VPREACFGVYEILPRYLTFSLYILFTFQISALANSRVAVAQETLVSIDNEATRESAKPTDVLRPVVEIELSGADREVEVTRRVMAELLTGLPVTIKWSRSQAVDQRYVLANVPDQKEVLARFWVELNRPYFARVYVSEGISGTLLVRTISAPQGIDPVVTESIGQLAGSVVDALLAGGTLGVQRRDATSLSSNHAFSVSDGRSMQSQTISGISPARELEVNFALGYQVQGYSSAELLAHYMTASLIIARSIPDWTPTGWLALHYRFPSVLEPEPVGTRLEGVGGRLFAGMVSSESRALRWRVGAGGGVDAIRIDPFVKEGTTATAAKNRWRAIPTAAAALQVQFDLGSTAALFAAVGIDLPLVHVHFYEQRPTGQRNLLVPWFLQPSISLGATFDIVPRGN